MSMYVRIKREKLTIFLHVEPTDTVAQVKSKLEELIQQVGGGVARSLSVGRHGMQSSSQSV